MVQDAETDFDGRKLGEAIPILKTAVDEQAIKLQEAIKRKEDMKAKIKRIKEVIRQLSIPTE